MLPRLLVAKLLVEAARLCATQQLDGAPLDLVETVVSRALRRDDQPVNLAMLIVMLNEEIHSRSKTLEPS